MTEDQHIVTEPAATTSPIPPTPKPDRWSQRVVWIGFVVTLFGVLSYFLYFSRFPDLRDFPVINLPIVIVGVILAGGGCWRVFRWGNGAFGKASAGGGFLLTLGLAGLFNFYVFSMSYQLPESPHAAATEKPAPDFTLLDQNGRRVRLSGFRGKKVVLVFYRGDW